MKNKSHLSIPQLRQIYESELFRFDTISAQCDAPLAKELEQTLFDIEDGVSKVFHPLLIESWRNPRHIQFRETPIRLVGLDIETNSQTGEPMLLGFWSERYSKILHPTLPHFYKAIKTLTDNGRYDALCVWGNLDIQAIIRLFEPTQDEQRYISSGFAGKWQKKQWTKLPPVQRKIRNIVLVILQYIPGRALQLGYVRDGNLYPVWIFNITQFYKTKIETAVKGSGLEWISFERDTHIIDWARFEVDSSYATLVYASNEQDCKSVRLLADLLQERFFATFNCYPRLLVSTGSLTDAAVSWMLQDDKEAYSSINYKWLERNVWHKTPRQDLAELESLLCECFSAGYVDQYGVGFTPEIHSADIASAYPFQIRNMPDLRNCVILSMDLSNLSKSTLTCIISGEVSIPSSLKYHPITVKTPSRENIRPTGTFRAVYTLEERNFCAKYGATFQHESGYEIRLIGEPNPHPLGIVSTKLGEMRSTLLAEKSECKDPERKQLLEGMQYLVKVIDNSIYGKTVMTLESVADSESGPVITGYTTGDKFNLLLGTLITSRTRILLAEACMQIQANGGNPILCMTDSVFWTGSKDALPKSFIRQTKTAGFFESPVTYTDAFIVKTGQYEYIDGKKWVYKLRGIPIDRTLLGVGSVYRSAVSNAFPYVGHPLDFTVQFPIKKLVTIGQHDLESLALIKELDMTLHPFRMSGKMIQIESIQDILNTMLPMEVSPVEDRNATRQLRRLTEIYSSQVVRVNTGTLPATLKANHNALRKQRLIYALTQSAISGKPIPPDARDMGWERLESWYRL